VYPRAVAGTPTAYGFDVRTGRFHLSYVARHVTHGPTVITVPNTVHYPNGYRVSTSGVWVIRKAADQVQLVNKPWAHMASVS
jgi:endoglycosylceramidase